MYTFNTLLLIEYLRLVIRIVNLEIIKYVYFFFNHNINMQD